MTNSSKTGSELLAKSYPVGLVLLLAVLYGRQILRGEWQGVVFMLAVFAAMILYCWWSMRRFDRGSEQITFGDGDDTDPDLP